MTRPEPLGPSYNELDKNPERKFRPASSHDDIDAIHAELSKRGSTSRPDRAVLERIMADVKELSDRYSVSLSGEYVTLRKKLRDQRAGTKTTPCEKTDLLSVALTYSTLHERLRPQDVEVR